MATTILLLSSLYLSTFFLLVHTVTAKHSGFTIELIHRDSIKSPFYPGNLTMEEKLARFYDQTNYHFNRVWANSSKNRPNLAMRAPVEFEQSAYTALVGFGSFGQNPATFTKRYLVADTGSDMTWTQCEQCKECFPQASPLFPFSRSTTYSPLICDKHPLCTPGQCDANLNLCVYYTEYVSGARTEGYLASETLTFDADNGYTQSIPDIVFGCGIHQLNFVFPPNNRISGIFGIGYGPRSFITQVAKSVGGQFSYCLQPWSSDPGLNTQLRFGDDAHFNPGEQVQTTPLLKGDKFHAYYVNLLDISIGGRRLNYPPGTFAMRPDGSGGCGLDIGSSSTLIRTTEYVPVRIAVLKYILGRNEHLPVVKQGSYDLCFLHSTGPLDLPTIVLHFENADMVVGEGAFYATPDYFCLGIVPHNINDISVIIGNHFQTNHKFLYNINDLTLSFADSNCQTDS